MSEAINKLRALRGPWIGDGFTHINRNEILDEFRRLERERDEACEQNYTLAKHVQALERERGEPLSVKRIAEIEAEASKRYVSNGRLIEWPVVFARLLEREHNISDLQR